MAEVQDRLTHCPFPKHKGKPWEEVVEDDPQFIRWLLYEGPDLDDELFAHLAELIDE